MNTVREYRGWSVEQQQWIYGTPLQSMDGNWYIFPEHSSLGWHKHFIVDPESINQYTGLNDKNDKKIYEGDIFADGWDKLVSWNKYEPGYCILDFNGEDWECLSDTVFDEYTAKNELEVISNRYEEYIHNSTQGEGH